MRRDSFFSTYLTVDNLPPNTYCLFMDENVSKHGTDARFPVWMGTRIDPKYINGATTIALLVNYAGVLTVHLNAIRSIETTNWSFGTIIPVVLAVMICMLTSLIIRHSNPLTQNIIRAYACGLPIIVHLGLIYLRTFPNY